MISLEEKERMLAEMPPDLREKGEIWIQLLPVTPLTPSEIRELPDDELEHLFPCRTCGLIFGISVAHCMKCGKHRDLDEGECCLCAKPFEVADFAWARKLGWDVSISPWGTM